MSFASRLFQSASFDVSLEAASLCSLLHFDLGDRLSYAERCALARARVADLVRDMGTTPFDEDLAWIDTLEADALALVLGLVEVARASVVFVHLTAERAPALLLALRRASTASSSADDRNVVALQLLVDVAQSTL